MPGDTFPGLLAPWIARVVHSSAGRYSRPSRLRTDPWGSALTACRITIASLMVGYGRTARRFGVSYVTLIGGWRRLGIAVNPPQGPSFSLTGGATTMAVEQTFRAVSAVAGRLYIHPEGVPLVSTTGRAGELLGIPADQLARAITAAGLRPWGTHDSGEPVWRWGELLAVAAAWGCSRRPRSTGSTAVGPARSRSARSGGGATATASHRRDHQEVAVRKVGWVVNYRGQDRVSPRANLTGFVAPRRPRRPAPLRRRGSRRR
jgi:hypothetical protein